MVCAGESDPCAAYFAEPPLGRHGFRRVLRMLVDHPVQDGAGVDGVLVAEGDHEPALGGPGEAVQPGQVIAHQYAVRCRVASGEPVVPRSSGPRGRRQYGGVGVQHGPVHRIGHGGQDGFFDGGGLGEDPQRLVGVGGDHRGVEDPDLVGGVTDGHPVGQPVHRAYGCAGQDRVEPFGHRPHVGRRTAADRPPRG